jgi:hypothetical protein
MGTRCEKQAIDIAWNIVDFTEYENDSENAERQLPRLGSGVRIASPAPFSSGQFDVGRVREMRLAVCARCDLPWPRTPFVLPVLLSDEPAIAPVEVQVRPCAPDPEVLAADDIKSQTSRIVPR